MTSGACRKLSCSKREGGSQVGTNSRAVHKTYGQVGAKPHRPKKLTLGNDNRTACRGTRTKCHVCESNLSVGVFVVGYSAPLGYRLEGI